MVVEDFWLDGSCVEELRDRMEVSSQIYSLIALLKG